MSAVAWWMGMPVCVWMGKIYLSHQHTPHHGGRSAAEDDDVYAVDDEMTLCMGLPV
jgi:hypothetical protein